MKTLKTPPKSILKLSPYPLKTCLRPLYPRGLDKSSVSEGSGGLARNSGGTQGTQAAAQPWAIPGVYPEASCEWEQPIFLPFGTPFPT